MPRICAIADLHGNLPEIPDCDILAIAGDISPSFMTKDSDVDHKADYAWWIREFGPWLVKLVERGIAPFAVAGNHDFLCESFGDEWTDRFPWLYLQDEGVEFRGVKIWGTPWQPFFGNWAFNAPEFDTGEEFLEEKFSLIPEGIDLLISHCPPQGILDRVGSRHCGSAALNRAIQRTLPKLTVFGHVHVGYGVDAIEPCMFANVALCDSKNRLVNRPMLFDL